MSISNFISSECPPRVPEVKFQITSAIRVPEIPLILPIFSGGYKFFNGTV
jgi:hypothetical protein